ncbi:COX15/CtaA family protein [Cellulomonas cellasea]|uniref:Cytochrome c oxidase assembly protein subunit 15 n=1 Tax=Cellulomonas cellasea TaxID=43670 RepID=A0A7W4UDG4_9CELL|nr:COX15/CtaA family protein [Cellulomonas cellasea]MBB2922183.1 cytochrome c oxidase assembly protein subunit 15 [Cellulomonas cellasea]
MSTAPVTAPPARRDPLARWRTWTRPALVANLVAQVVIIVTGGAVRLTGSGLGCSTWPQCEPGEFTPALHSASTIHPFIEFGNRTLTGVLGVIAIAVAALVWTDLTRSPGYRRLGLLPLVGVVLQAVVGGIIVLLELPPALVGLHMIISLGLVAASTALVVRHRQGDGPPRAVVGPRVLTLSRVLVGVAVVMLALGILVTGSGPHGGDEEVAYRFAFDPVLAAKLHAASVWAFLALLTVLVVGLLRAPAPQRTRRAAVVLVVVTLAQGLVGYVQYFTGLPALLVGVHMLGAALLAAALTAFVRELRPRA